MNRAFSALCCVTIFVTLPLCSDDNTEEEHRDTRPHYLSVEQRSLLKKDKIMIGDKSFKQIFEAYTFNEHMSEYKGMPAFITTDSVLNGFHVLLQESLYKLIKSRVYRLRDVLVPLWNNLGKLNSSCYIKNTNFNKAKRQAEIVLGTAVLLLGEKSLVVDSDAYPIIEKEVEQIIKAKDSAPLKWRCEDESLIIDPANIMHYSGFKPQGFYYQRHDFTRYFQAVRWLQAVPFRVDKTSELAAFVLLGEVFLQLSSDGQKKLSRFLSCWNVLTGKGDEGNLVDIGVFLTNNPFTKKDGLPAQKIREFLIDAGKIPLVNDKPRFHPVGILGGGELSFRVISASPTPEHFLFQKTTYWYDFPDRPFPKGLELCAALGSEKALEVLQKREPNGDKFVSVIRQNRTQFGSDGFFGDSILQDYWKCLGTLFDPPHPKAPDFMFHSLWKTKSWNTVLGGWVQMRHSLVLQIKPYDCFTSEPIMPGFVEPNVRFYKKLALLAGRIRLFLKSNGGFDVDLWEMAEDMQKARNILEEELPKARNIFEKKLLMRTPIDNLFGVRGVGKVEYSYVIEQAFKKAWNEKIKTKEDVEKVIRVLEECEKQLRTGQIPKQKQFYDEWKERLFSLSQRWNELFELCETLAKLAEKQLNHEAFTPKEREFIHIYGYILSSIMLYEYQACFYPRDDAPRIVTSGYNPELRRYFLIGTGRAREVFVLYPHNGEEIICRGAILPYYEFSHPTSLNDSEWKKMLDSKDRPESPDYLQPLFK